MITIAIKIKALDNQWVFLQKGNIIKKQERGFGIAVQ